MLREINLENGHKYYNNHVVIRRLPTSLDREIYTVDFFDKDDFGTFLAQRKFSSPKEALDFAYTHTSQPLQYEF